jgi:O-antigen/teichoic acid export membrane protein
LEVVSLSLGSKLVGNSAFLFLDWLAITVLSLVFWMIIGKTLPRESYGIVATALNIIVILSGITLMGMQTTIVKMISEFNQRDQRGKVSRLLRFTIKAVLVVSSIFSAAIILLSPVLSPVLNLPIEVMITIAVGLFVFSLWTLTTSVMYGFQNMKEIMRTDFVGNVVKVVLTFFLIMLGMSYFGPLAGLIVGVAAVVLMRLGTLNLARKKIVGTSSLNLRAVFTYSASAFVISAATLIFANTPNIILNAITGPTVTALFAISLTITSPIFSIPGILNSALFPITSALSASKNGKQNQKALINMVLRYASLITLPIVMILLTFSGTIILFFSDESFLPATEILPVVGVAAFLFGIGGILNTSVYAIGKPNASRNITILSVVTFLVIAFPLTIAMSIIGMAVAYLVSVVVLCTSSLLYLRRSLGFSLDLVSFAKILVAVAVFSGIIIGIDNLFTEPLVKLVGTVLASVVYFAVLLPLRFYKNEDLRVLDLLSKKSPVGKGVFLRIMNVLQRYS